MCGAEQDKGFSYATTVLGFAVVVAVVGLLLLLVHNSHISARHESRSKYYQRLAHQNAERADLLASVREADVAFFRGQDAECRGFLTELEGDYMEMLFKYLALRFERGDNL